MLSGFVEDAQSKSSCILASFDASSHVALEEKKCRICCYKQGSNCNIWVFLGTSEANLLNKDDFMHMWLTADTECHSALLYSFTERKENYGV